MERQFSCPQFFGVRSQNKVKYLPGEQQKFDEIRVSSVMYVFYV